METNIADYNQFVDKLKVDLQNFPSTSKDIWNETATKNVNGFAADELRRIVNIETRRQYGAFFTDSFLAKRVLQSLKLSFNKDSYIYDPACGAGNLLLAISNYVEELNINLKWENHLLGTDIHNEFVEAAKLRLITNCILKQPGLSVYKYELERDKKYSIIKADGLVKNQFYEKATHIFVNPPFNQMVADEKLCWAKGKVSTAALFMDKIIQNCNKGVSIIAILPDVLRSGSRYQKWRSVIEKECKIEKVELLGQFDKYADVDIYALQLTKRKRRKLEKDKEKSKKIKNEIAAQTLKDLFYISVGPVVDNRDPHEGTPLRYIVSKGLEDWHEKKEEARWRKHKGKSFESPFVVIKRTSRMSDLNRAKATIINIPAPVYIDNHLIILRPKSGKLSDCQKVINLLMHNRTNDWLNEMIRCRHLTVSVVSKIPLQ